MNDEEEFSTELPDSSSIKKPRSETLLDQLRQEVQKEVELPDVLMPIPLRPEIELVIKTSIDKGELKGWRKRAGEGQRKDGMDPLIFATYVVAGTTQAILINGEEVTNDDGVSVTFASPEIKEMADADTPLEVVKYFFVKEPHIENAALAILDAAGYGDEVEVKNRTTG